MKTKLFTFFLVLAASIGITKAAIVDGTCGDNLTWSLNTIDSTLTIEGNGDMYMFSYDEETDSYITPWSSYSSYIAYAHFPDGLKSIGDGAFSGCNNLTSMIIPNGVTSIGDNAFWNCYSSTSVTIPNSVTSIGEGAFSVCTSLTSITLPNSITSIGGYAFSCCRNLIYVTIPNSVTSIEDGVFSGCHSLTSITIPNNITSIEDYAFLGCHNLTLITIPECVTNIGNSAFNGCISLTSITIPNSVISIGDRAFDECISLIQITCEAVAPPVIEANTFEDKTIPLFVPEESIEAYSNAIIWEEFTNIFAIGTIIGTYSVEFRDWDGTVLKTETVNHGSAAEAPEDPYREGYTFIGWDVDFNSVKEDLIVTAQYELGENKTFQISFNDKDNNIIIQNEVVLKVPAAPEIEGFTFLGWRPVANIIEYNYIEIEAVYEAENPTSAPEVVNPRNAAQKLIREGNVYILHEGKSYSVQGLEVK